MNKSDHVFWDESMNYEINNFPKVMNMVSVPIENYVNKLVKQWEKYGKIIIAVDWDDTLVGHSTNNKETCKEVCKLISGAQKLGAKVILWTCRRWIDIGIYAEQLAFENKFKINEVNPIEPFKENYSHKPYCNILLDDKAGLEQSMAILKEAIKIYDNTKKTNEFNESSGKNGSDNER